jgi:integrase-like protein/helix-turn-helix protein
VPRSTYYYQPRPESAENLRLLRRLDQLYMKRPFYGSRKMAVELEVNRKRIQRLMRILGIEAHYPKPNLSRPAPGHQIYPYLLRGVEILRPNHVWSTDITYIPMRGGFLYLVAVMDWFSRYVLSWELSNTMETGFCLAALDAAFRFGQPEIWNSDQGSQFTSADFLAPLTQEARHLHQHGWTRPRVGQRVHRTLVALAQVRVDLSRRLRHRPRSVSGAGQLLPLLQSRAAPTRRWAIRRRRICSRTDPKGRGHPLDGGRCPPNPLGFSAFVFQNGCFSLYSNQHLPYNRFAC